MSEPLHLTEANRRAIRAFVHRHFPDFGKEEEVLTTSTTSTNSWNSPMWQASGHTNVSPMFQQLVQQGRYTPQQQIQLGQQFGTGFGRHLGGTKP